MKAEVLKEQARLHEQREEWTQAIELYSRVVDALDLDDQPDLALYNRLGDLEIRVGNVDGAVEHYEKAIDLYLESELPNNAIAICRKVVRNLPTRHHIFLKMGQIRAKQGFLTDARANFLEYAERMQRGNDLEEAFRALIEFVELAPEDNEARLALATQLEAHERTAEAVEQYVAIHQRLTLKERDEEAREIEDKIRALDATAVIPPPEEAESPGAPTELAFETTSLVSDFDGGAGFLEDLPEADTTLDVEAELGDLHIALPDDGAEDTAAAVEDTFAAAEDTFAAVEDTFELESGAPVPDGSELELESTALSQELPDAPEDDSLDDVDLGFGDLELGEATPAYSDPDEDPEPLPLIDFEDGAPAKDSVDAPPPLASEDFGVRDDGEREGDYVEVSESVPALDVRLEEFGLESLDAPGDGADLFETETGDAAGVDGAGFTGAVDEGWPLEAEPAAADLGASDPIGALQRRLEQDPDDGHAWLELSQEFHARSRVDESLLAVEQALTSFRATDDSESSVQALHALISYAPDVVEHRQRLVELAIKRSDADLLATSYVGLAACLVRAGDGVRARSVYQQALLTDPQNTAARSGLAALESAPSGPALEVASSEDYVDLGSMVLDLGEEKTTRWTVVAEEPSGDDEADFAKMLSQFKEKVAENLEADDLAAHYDLGTAYKEMGLVDEAISEFQQALRAQADHLPTHELLGQCFMEKEQFEVAVHSMGRALDAGPEVEDELLGIYYQLARAHEQLGNKGEALEFYEKVFALDINFQDVTERLRELR